VGIVMGLEVSRLARNSADWHRLIQICSVTDTLVLDESSIYDPTTFNDKFLLGIKGTMAEAELHTIMDRLQGGLLNKARRNALEIPLPTGFIYDSEGKAILDPDKQVQETIHLFFKIFRSTGSCRATVVHFNKNNIEFPLRVKSELPVSVRDSKIIHIFS
jgi:DNA invertase Pin-like site-specific DNA recombinase